MADKKYQLMEEAQEGMVAEPWRDNLAYSTDDSDTAIATDEECSNDWNEEMDEIAQMGIKVAIEQMERGEGYTLEDLLKDRDKIFGIS